MTEQELIDQWQADRDAALAEGKIPAFVEVYVYACAVVDSELLQDWYNKVLAYSRRPMK